MRIVIDLQGAQSTGSRSRGIGRYSLSLALAIVRYRGQHEVLLALNGRFQESVGAIRSAFEGLLPPENIRVWHPLGSVSGLGSGNDWRRHSSEMLREAFLASLEPDIVHVSSLFEGLTDDAVTSIGLFTNSFPTAVTLYDLIPLIHRRPYLENPLVEKWYMHKVGYLRKADLCLAISDSSRKEGVDYLGLPIDRVVNVSTASDGHFSKLEISSDREAILRREYGLKRPFVMYTGGIDHRKNIEGLIRSFASLEESLRNSHQLAIVCSVQPENRQALRKLAESHGLTNGEIVFTGFIPEDDLVALYNICKLFVFPSLHEGFGLPALEAMHCGAPVIGANASSIPEVIGWDEALFDPHSDKAIAVAITRGLTDEAYRKALITHGQKQATCFSWDESAKRAIAAMERLHVERQPIRQVSRDSRRKLAYVSPLPAERSGIADYSAELLPELVKFYAIDVIVAQESVSDEWIKSNCTIRSVDWLVRNSDQYDRVLYHFGNSAFHEHMFDLLKTVPGVIVLHDFYLSGIMAYRDARGGADEGVWAKELYHSHGYGAFAERYLAMDPAEVIWKYPCNLSVLQEALGVIVHSRNSMRLVHDWYGSLASVDWVEIPLVRDSRVKLSREDSRTALGLDENDCLVCSFGMLGPTKLNHRLLDAWLKSGLADRSDCHLVFVGENHGGEYGNQLMDRIRDTNAGDRIRITGWADETLFRSYLAAADIGVQLRTLSRGETSAAVLDCMNYGLATIINANGSMADLPEVGVCMLPDDFTDDQLINSLQNFVGDTKKRSELGRSARELIVNRHNPTVCAKQYHDAIETFYGKASKGLHSLVGAIGALEGETGKDLPSLASAIAISIPPVVKVKQVFVDVSELLEGGSRAEIQRVVRGILLEWLRHPMVGVRVEPVYAKLDRGYYYARQFSLKLLDSPLASLPDEPIDFYFGDIFIGCASQSKIGISHLEYIQEMHHQGVCVKFLVHDVVDISNFMGGSSEQHRNWGSVIAKSNGAICLSKSLADELAAWLKFNCPRLSNMFGVDFLNLAANVGNELSGSKSPGDFSDKNFEQLAANLMRLVLGSKF